MLGNRGETRADLPETLDFLERAKPHQYIFSCLSIYPGTHDFQDAERRRLARSRRVYFEGDFQELKVPFDASRTRRACSTTGSRPEPRPAARTTSRTSNECRAVLGRLGDHHAGAPRCRPAPTIREGELEPARIRCAAPSSSATPRRASPTTTWRCIARARGDLDGMKAAVLDRGAKTDPQHQVLIEQRRGGAGPGSRSEGRSATCRSSSWVATTSSCSRSARRQPTLPGPLAEDFADFCGVARARAPAAGAAPRGERSPAPRQRERAYRLPGRSTCACSPEPRSRQPLGFTVSRNSVELLARRLHRRLPGPVSLSSSRRRLGA